MAESSSAATLGLEFALVLEDEVHISSWASITGTIGWPSEMILGVD